MALGIEQIDDFVATIHQKFSGEDRLAAQDISLPLQEYKYASRLFSGNLKKDTMSTSQCKWKVKVNTNNNFQVVGLYHRDSSGRVSTMSEGELKWGLRPTTTTTTSTRKFSKLVVGRFTTTSKTKNGI